MQYGSVFKTKNTLLLIIICLRSITSFGQQQESPNADIDIWSGRYKVIPFSNDSITTYKPQYFVIERIKDENPENLAVKYRDDTTRWTIKLESQPNDDKEEIRRFLFNKDNNGYEEFGWTDLHKQGKMDCIDGGNFFICQTTTKTEITIFDEILYTDSGVFGVLLHHGPFQLSKLNICCD
ncbi:phosphate ABC transporter permease [Aquimarina sp. I32.4]|uniref:phosphate ABC transporter permease n=1 Tax=Aquimarina sp. I32.4 TaxID=2053903 RepID=UPI000CDE77AF|nr:phosphate ABC transporter permease [Aquimarina sp. I32.4]